MRKSKQRTIRKTRLILGENMKHAPLFSRAFAALPSALLVLCCAMGTTLPAFAQTKAPVPAEAAKPATPSQPAKTSATPTPAKAVVENTNADVIRIGLSGPFTGGSAPLGISMREGVRIAVEEINLYVGGVLGKKIVLVERDDQANAAAGGAVANDLINGQRVIATVGIVNTGVGLSSIDVYQKSRIPVIIAVSTGTVLTKKFAPPAAPENFIFRVAPRTDIETSFLIDHITGRTGISNIAIFADATPYGESAKVDLEKAMAAKNMKPVYVGRFNIGDTDMSAQLKAAKESGAEAIIMYGVGPEMAAIVKSRDAIKWKVPTFASWAASMQSFIEQSGKSGENVMMPLTFVAQSSHVRARAFVTRYAQRTGSSTIPSPMAAAQGYDAMRILYNAIQNAASQDGTLIKNALENIRSIEGVITTHRAPFSAADHDAVSPSILVMGKIQGGRADYAFAEDANKSVVLRKK
jgi:branched-chain amino acid transport system substrate-binding protein